MNGLDYWNGYDPGVYMEINDHVVPWIYQTNAIVGLECVEVQYDVQAVRMVKAFSIF